MMYFVYREAPEEFASPVCNCEARAGRHSSPDFFFELSRFSFELLPSVNGQRRTVNTFPLSFACPVRLLFCMLGRSQ
jgi:hypothetical protein